MPLGVRDNYEKCTNILEGGEWISSKLANTDDFKLGETPDMYWKNKGDCQLRSYNWTETYQCLTGELTQKSNLTRTCVFQSARTLIFFTLDRITK